METDFFSPVTDSEVEERIVFLGKVLEILNVQFPDRSFSGSLDGKCIKSGRMRLNVAGVKVAFDNWPKEKYDLAELVRIHLHDFVRSADLDLPPKLSPGTGGALLMPQLIPSREIDRMQKEETSELMRFPFAGEIEIALVVDAEKFFKFVTKADFDNWLIEPERLLAIAVDNLNDR